MKVAYVSHQGRPCYEFNWFSKITADKVKFIDIDFSAYPVDPPEHIEYCKVRFDESAAWKGKFHSTARIIKYRAFEEHLSDVDVVIVLEAFSSLSRQFVKYCRENNKKVVVLVYELIATHPLYYLPTHIFNRLYTIRHADLFVCVSHKAKNSLLQLGVAAEKIKVVYPGIDLNLFKPSTRREHNRNLIFVGTLEKHKGIDQVLLLADKILPLHQDLQLSVAGDGSYRDIVIEYTKKYSNFKYLGRVANADLPAILNQHRICILPARDTYKFGIKIGSEQFGFSLVEAMACGLAVISTNCGAIPEIIGEDNLWCSQEDTQRMYTLLTQLLGDESGLQSLTSKNLERARQEFDVNEQAKRLSMLLV